MVLAEQGEHQRLVGVQNLQARHEEQVEDKNQYPQHHHGHRQPRVERADKHRPADSHGDAAQKQQQNKGQHGEAIFCLHRFFCIAIDDLLSSFHGYNSFFVMWI